MLRPRVIVSMALIFLFGVGTLALRPERRIVPLGMMVFPVVFLVLYRRMVNRIVAQHPEFLETQTMSFNDSGISITNSVTSVRWPWSRIRGVTDSRDFYVFRFDTLGSGAVIPKRALSAEQADRLLSHAKSKVA
jgi:YcxB-like protein